VIVHDRRLRALHRLLRDVEGDDIARVQEAIRQHQRVLEDRQYEAEYPTAFGTSSSAVAALNESEERVLPVSGGHRDEVRRSAGSRAVST
jgi:hypothetical protein